MKKIIEKIIYTQSYLKKKINFDWQHWDSNPQYEKINLCRDPALLTTTPFQQYTSILWLFKVSKYKSNYCLSFLFIYLRPFFFNYLVYGFFFKNFRSEEEKK